MGDRILVTGGTGFLGAHVTRHLAGRGFDVVTASTSPVPDDLPGEHVKVDLRDQDAARRAARGARFVVHLAATSGGIGFQRATDPGVFQTNRALTDSVLEAAAAEGVERVFLASSGVIYRDKVQGSLDEDDEVLGPADHPSPYAWSKISDEVVGSWWRSSGSFEVVIGRFGNIYGPGAPLEAGRSTVVHALVARAVGTPPGGLFSVWGTGMAVRSFIFVEDAARAVAVILRRGQDGSAYNVDSGVPTTIGELASVIRDRVDPSLELTFDTDRPEGSPIRVLDSSKVTELGWKPRIGLHEGLRVTVRAMRQDNDGPP